MNKLGICIPSYESWMADFGCSLVYMFMKLKKSSGIDSVMFNNSRGGSGVAELRYDLIKWSLECNCTHILFIDADMVFPPWLAERLISHDVDIVAVNQPLRNFPLTQTASIGDENNIEGVGIEGDELIQADRIPFGIVMFKADIFRKLEQPWFLTPYIEGKYMTEDYYFSNKIKNSGLKIMVDPFLSRCIGHAGKHVFSYAHIDNGPVPANDFCHALWDSTYAI